ncbi:unnamed protein product [Prorocentrum cordatum]|uniref:Uncharacterized protein n=1 Tax=Prorocentrum cordatum TaxID=2364126 RepID=A0ABN9YHA9_9DINO|nr:unnamed protein product [Polarella glacialis]
MTLRVGWTWGSGRTSCVVGAPCRRRRRRRRRRAAALRADGRPCRPGGLARLIAVDYRGFGWSGGAPSMAALRADVSDLLVALPAWHAARGLRWPPAPGRLVLLGRSLGAQAALHAAALLPPPLRAALVLDSPAVCHWPLEQACLSHDTPWPRLRPTSEDDDNPDVHEKGCNEADVVVADAGHAAALAEVARLGGVIAEVEAAEVRAGCWEALSAALAEAGAPRLRPAGRRLERCACCRAPGARRAQPAREAAMLDAQDIVSGLDSELLLLASASASEGPCVPPSRLETDIAEVEAPILTVLLLQALGLQRQWDGGALCEGRAPVIRDEVIGQPALDEAGACTSEELAAQNEPCNQEPIGQAMHMPLRYVLHYCYNTFNVRERAEDLREGGPWRDVFSHSALEIRDASHILPHARAQQMYYHGMGPDGRWRGWAPFADWFRYEVMARHGGWWVDADSISVRNLARLTDGPPLAPISGRHRGDRRTVGAVALPDPYAPAEAELHRWSAELPPVDRQAQPSPGSPGVRSAHPRAAFCGWAARLATAGWRVGLITNSHFFVPPARCSLMRPLADEMRSLLERYAAEVEMRGKEAVTGLDSRGQALCALPTGIVGMQAFQRFAQKLMRESACSAAVDRPLVLHWCVFNPVDANDPDRMHRVLAGDEILRGRWVHAIHIFRIVRDEWERRGMPAPVLRPVTCDDPPSTPDAREAARRPARRAVRSAAAPQALAELPVRELPAPSGPLLKRRRGRLASAVGV